MYHIGRPPKRPSAEANNDQCYDGFLNKHIGGRHSGVWVNSGFEFLSNNKKDCHLNINCEIHLVVVPSGFCFVKLSSMGSQSSILFPSGSNM